MMYYPAVRVLYPLLDIYGAVRITKPIPDFELVCVTYTTIAISNIFKKMKHGLGLDKKLTDRWNK